MNGQITTVFYARGFPQLHRTAVAVMAVAMVLTVYPLAKWLGPDGGQWACLIAVILGLLLQIARVRGLTGLDLGLYGNGALPALLASTGVVAFSLLTRAFTVPARPAVNVAFGAFGCLLAYLLVFAFLMRRQADPSQKSL
jgi:hypothetical protein